MSTEANHVPDATRADAVLLLLQGEIRAATDIIGRLPEKLSIACSVGDVVMSDVEIARVKALVFDAAAKAIEIVGALSKRAPTNIHIGDPT